jgi:hypothetical protein
VQSLVRCSHHLEPRLLFGWFINRLNHPVMQKSVKLTRYYRQRNI